MIMLNSEALIEISKWLQIQILKKKISFESSQTSYATFLKSRPLFCLFTSFHTPQFKFKLIKAFMLLLGFEPGTAILKAQTNQLSYGGTPSYATFNRKCNQKQEKIFQFPKRRYQNDYPQSSKSI